MLDSKQTFVILDTMRTVLKRDPILAKLVIDEQSKKLDIDFSVINNAISEGRFECALTVIQHELKRVGMKLSQEKLMIPKIS